MNFLNANRTFFINTQWFVQYTDEFQASYAGGYAWDIFGVLAISTGYFQDRLLPSLTAGLLRAEQLLRGAAAGHLPLHRELPGQLRHRRASPGASRSA